MTRFITPGPMPALRGRDSAFDPVLAGVAQGLARLFPAIEAARTSEPPAPGTSDPAHRRESNRPAAWAGLPTEPSSGLTTGLRSADGAQA